MNELDRWPGSIADTVVLATAIGKFLRTHRNGDRLLWEWLDSVPADRTEEEYQRECRERHERHESHIRAKLEEFNAYQRARGLGEVDRKGNIVRGPGAPRNRKQSERARSERQEIERLLHNKPQLTSKQIRQILGWPITKLRTVERHVRAIRARG